MPDEYTVFHGVHWTRDYQGRTVYGEIDFAVLNRAGDVMVIEQKNGRLEETADGLVKVYDDQAKNVGAQVHRSLDNLRDKFRHLRRRDGSQRKRLRLSYLIYCPDYRLMAVNAAGLERERVVDATAACGIVACACIDRPARLGREPEEGPPRLGDAGDGERPA